MNEHYYSEVPTSEIKEKHFTSEINGMSLKFISVSGVFGFSDRIDKVSQLLIKSFKPSGNKVLDIGCGYGAIGLFLKALYPDISINMSDINHRALLYSKKNANNNNLDVNVIYSTLFKNFESELFNDIVSNPPFATGKSIYTKLIVDSISYLEKGGTLWLTAFHNKGGSTLKSLMENTFGNVEDMEKSGGIRVYKSIKTD
jgi:16S rRNA (guanine1207-N2)-methyltransferase